MFKNGEMNGEGTIIDEDGKKEKGTWVDGLRIEKVGEDEII